MDLVGSDDDENDVKAEPMKWDELKTNVERKAAKSNIIAKSIVTLDVCAHI
jgi:hypothetical protein